MVAQRTHRKKKTQKDTFQNSSSGSCQGKTLGLGQVADRGVDFVSKFHYLYHIAIHPTVLCSLRNK